MHQQNNAPARNSELRRILLYIVIIFGVGIVNSVVYGAVSRVAFELLWELGMAASLSGVFSTLLNIADKIAVGIAEGLLFRRFVFHSKKNPTPAIILLCVLNIAVFFTTSAIPFIIFEVLKSPRVIINGYIVSHNYSSIHQALSIALTVGASALGYFLQRRMYRIDSTNTAKVFSASNAPDPAIVTVDLEAIEKRSDAEIRSRIFSPGAADDNMPRRSFGLFNRFDTENDGERVIAQSSRDAIRVMEHKDLNMAHEWNCDERGKNQPQQSASRHVIAPGSGNPVHVTEHSALDMKHEWNCDDRKPR